MKKLAMALAAASALTVCAAVRGAEAEPHWKKLVLSDRFYCEGANFGDFNKDGKMDVVAGPYWYEGPDFKVRHEIYKPTGSQPDGSWKPDNDYSNAFLVFVYDFTGDGYDDYLVYGFPGAAARVYVNPGKEGVGKEQMWKEVDVFDSVDNESPQFGDITGDGKPDGIFHSGHHLGYATADWSDPLKKWTFHPISPMGGWERFTHGYGFGDVNGDGRMDIIESHDWWEQPADKNAKEWIKHPYKFFTPGNGEGGAQIYVYDVDGDGLNDVVTSLQAHGCGLAWFKQVKDASGQITFERNLILPDKYVPSPQGVKFSQLHAVDLVDVNGDGLKDIVTGKRYYAHGSHGDVAPNDPAMLYWFELKRTPAGVQYIPHKIDDDSGIGTQVIARDINGDGIADIVVGNKKGTFVFISEKPTAAAAAK